MDTGLPETSEACISVVLPVYDEEATIERCLRGLWAALRDHEHEILVCYDYDEDTTLGAIARMESPPPSLRLVRNDLGRGAANALRAGFAAARGDVVVTTMADLSDPPEVIPALAAELRRDGAAVVSGSRYMPGGSQRGGPWLKSRLSRAACLSLRWLAGLGTHDATNNFRAYSRAFLERTQVESRKAFDIALELTVKAHLAGERVSEIPSSWVDRSAGQSRFQLWRWMPSYLRWYRRAMAAPVLVWAVLATLFLWSWMRTGWSGTSAGAERVLACAQASLALAAILAARRLRGRMRAPDALHALLWLPPWLGELARPGLELPLAAAGSAALLAWAGGPARSRRALAASARAFAARADQRAALLVLFSALLWLARFALPEQPDTAELDPSWTRAYSWFFENGARAGVDYVFTYGPLGALQNGAYSGAGLFWTKVAVWELVVKGALAAALALGVARLRGPLEALLFALLLLVLPFEVDAYVLLCAMAVTVLALAARRAWPGFPLALALLAALAWVKFTYFSAAAACAASMAAVAAVRSSWRSGLGVLAGFGLALASVWILAGQSLLDLASYLRGSLEIAAGYSRAMSLPASGERVVLACTAIGLSSALAVLYAGGRPREPGRAMTAALYLAMLFLAFKAGFVRHGGSSTFFGFAALAPFLLLPLGERLGGDRPLGSWARAGATTGLRLACVCAALLGFDGLRAQPARAPFVYGSQAFAGIGSNLRSVLDLRGRQRAGEAHLADRRRHYVMPRTREVVGASTIDLVPNEVGLLILNQLDWKPRPVFQSYSAYTPALLDLNARSFSGASAPEFVLFRPGGLDHRLPTLDDALVLQVLLRDYRPELEEQGWLLLRRRAGAGGTAAPDRQVLVDRTVALGETLDLRELEGRCHVMEVDLRPSIGGRLVSALYQAPMVWIELGLAGGAVRVQRLVPEMTRRGAILDPPLASLDHWIDWYCGAPLPRVEWIRLRAQQGQEALLRREARVRVLRADDLEPRLEPEAVLRVISGVLPSPPDEVVSSVAPERVPLGRDRVLVVPAPGELRYRLAPGAFALSCIYGVLPAAQGEGNGDGATFRVLLRDAGGERTLFERRLDPARVAEDRGPQALRLEIDAGEGAQLVLANEPAASDDAFDDRAYWARVRIVDPQGRLRFRDAPAEARR